MQFEPSTPVYDACRIIRERVPEAQSGQGMSSKMCVQACLGFLQLLYYFYIKNVNPFSHNRAQDYIFIK